MSLRVVVDNAGRDIVVIQVRGAIDLATVHAWEDTIRRAIRSRKSGVIVDVSRVEHLSARGFEMLLALAANQSLIAGSLVLVGVRAPMRRTAQLVGLWDLASETTSVRAAVQKAEQNRAVREATRDLTKDIVRSSKRMARQGGGV